MQVAALFLSCQFPILGQLNMAKNSCCTRSQLLLGWRVLILDVCKSFRSESFGCSARWAVLGTGRYLARVGSLDIGRNSKFRIAPKPYPTFVFAKH
jgi:hypothetical protein